MKARRGGEAGGLFKLAIAAKRDDVYLTPALHIKKARVYSR